MAYQITSDRYIDIDGVPLETPAWHTVNLLEVFKPAAKRGGSGVLIPTRDGRVPVKARPDETTRTIQLWLENHVDWEGVAYENRASGFIWNVDHLKQEIIASPGTSDGTRVLTLHLGDDGDWVGDVVVLGMDFNEETGVATIDVNLVDGELTLSGS